MSDLTRYQYHSDKMRYKYADGMLVGDLINDGVLVPDDSLQQLADAWREYRESEPGSAAAALALHKVHSLVEGIER